MNRTRSAARPIARLCLSMTFAGVAGIAGVAVAAEPAAVPPLDEGSRRAILDATLTIRLAPDLSSLTAGERAAVDELLAAGRILQNLYEDQRHPQAAALRARVESGTGGGSAADPELATLYRLFQGPIATTLDNRRVPMVAVDPEQRGKNVYPWGVAEEEIDAFLAAHPERRGEILDDRSVVRRASAESLAHDLATLDRYPLLAGLHPFLHGALADLAKSPDAKAFYAVPYSVAWPEEHLAVFLHLFRAAAAVEGDDPELSGYLRNRARDFVSDDYESGDASWVTGRFRRLNAQIGAYETYDDALFGVKAFQSLSLLLRDEKATAELAKSIGSLQEIENALPYPAGAAPKTVRSEIPIGVYAIVADFGQARSTNTATNLPNDALHSRRYGRIILMRENILRNATLGDLATKRWKAAVVAAQAEAGAAAGGFDRTLWHEIGHYLGPDTTRDGRGLDDALGSWADAVEEMKADLVSLFAHEKLAAKGAIPKEKLRAVESGGILRTLNTNRPRRDQPYQTMQLAQFNYFLDQGLLTADGDARLTVHHEKYSATVTALLGELLELQAAGDPKKAGAFFERWSAWTPELHDRLGARLATAEGPRFRIVKYAALGD